MMIRVWQIAKSFENNPVYDDFSLEFPENEVTAILGPSGCGKTTLLNILAGLVRVDAGRVETEPETSYLFQEPRLLPWLSLRENIALVLADKLPAVASEARVDNCLAATGLAPYAEYLPNLVSGGMKQRAALARAFVYPSRLLLMDEPFKSQDLKTRHHLIELFLELWRAEPRTVITVTHDIQEALRLGNQVVVLSGKPVRIVERLRIDLPQEERVRRYEELFPLEKRLLGLVLG
jgi:NitT/TauT family transport system ATP-binding protein